MSGKDLVGKEFTGLRLMGDSEMRDNDGPMVPMPSPSLSATQTAIQTAPILFYASAIVRMSAKMMRERAREARAELATNIAETTRLRLQLRATADRLRIRIA